MTIRQIWTKQLVIQMLQAAQVNGVVSSVDAAKIHISLPSRARKYFGSFGDGCKAAGLISITDKPKHESCTVDGCQTKVRSARATLCHMHYARLGRTGTTDLNPKEVIDEKLTSNGYVTIPANGHPLAHNSRVYEHRAVYYNQHGIGPFNCYWCDTRITWDDLHIDHLDDVKTNNQIANLVASCPTCNMTRGSAKMKKAMQAKGINLTFNGVTKHISEWAQDLGISRVSLRNRIEKWTLEKALTTPRGRYGPKGFK